MVAPSSESMSKSNLNLNYVLSCVQLVTFCENLDFINFSCVLKQCDPFIFCFLDQSLAALVEKREGGVGEEGYFLVRISVKQVEMVAEGEAAGFWPRDDACS